MPYCHMILHMTFLLFRITPLMRFFTLLVLWQVLLDVVLSISSTQIPRRVHREVASSTMFPTNFQENLSTCLKKKKNPSNRKNIPLPNFHSKILYVIQFHYILHHAFVLSRVYIRTRTRHVKTMRTFDVDVFLRWGKQHLAVRWTFGKQPNAIHQMSVLQKKFAYDTFRCRRNFFFTFAMTGLQTVWE